MKSLNLIFVLLIMFSHQINAQQAWIKQSPPLYKSTFNDAYMLNKNTSIIIGSNCSILKTSDGGSNWVEINSNLSNSYISLKSIQFINSSTGWIAGSSNTLLSTTDGGSTWNPVTTDLSNYSSLYDVNFIDSNTGWILSGGTVYKTTNGGANWVAKLSSPSMTFLEAIFFYDANNGVAVGSTGTGKIFQTSDGGLNWTEKSVGGAAWIYDVYFSGKLNGWAVGLQASRITITTGGLFGETSIDIDNPSYALWRTTDGGINWTQKNLYYTGKMNKVYFVDKDNGWIVGEQGLILTTVDGGLTWNSIKSVHEMNAIYFYDSQTGISVGNDGTIITTDDGGDNWTLRSGNGTNKNLYSVHFMNNKEGWAIGSSGAILKTLDGGSTWFDNYIRLNSSSYDWYSMNFIDTLTGCIAGYGYPSILITTDGGANWKTGGSGWEHFYSISLSSSTKAWVVGNEGLLGYINLNSSWPSLNEVRAVTDNDLTSVCFTDENNGWVAGEDSTILHTTDGGETWISQKSGLPVGLPWGFGIASVYFLDNQNGWILGSNGFILKTVNGGVSWVESFELGTYLHDIFFINAQKGWAVGYEGKILRTEDGGDTWGLLDGQTSEDLQSVHFINEQTGWIAGFNGTILKTTTGGGTATYAPPIPSLLMPFDGATDIPVDQTLYWNDSQGATEYQIQVSADSTFKYSGIQFVQGTSINLNEMLYSVENEKKYFWRVRASNGILNSKWSNVWTFTTEEAIWVMQGDRVDYLDVCFINSTTGWVVGWSGEISSTTDGGNTWNDQSLNDYNIQLFSVQFINEINGWACGERYAQDGEREAIILHSNNGGQTWETQATFREPPYGLEMNDIYIIDNSIGYAVSNFSMYKTINGGIDWLEQPNTPGFQSIYFINKNIGWALAYNAIEKTNDCGESWYIQKWCDDPPYDTMEDIFFINENDGWMVGDFYINHTSNGGSDWSNQYENMSYLFNSVYFIDPMTGWVVGEIPDSNKSIVLKTTDGGDHWEGNVFPNVRNFKSVVFVDENNGWAVGDGIWHTTKSGIRTSIKENRLNMDDQPISFSLMQNYPNPFNSKTTICYTIPQEEHVTIKIFNINGQLVSTLLDKIQMASKYSIIWSGNNDIGQSLPSGIYLYQIRAGELTETRKMSLIR